MTSNNTFYDEEGVEHGSLVSLFDREDDSDSEQQSTLQEEEKQCTTSYKKYGSLAALLFVTVVALSSPLPAQYHSPPQNHRRLVHEEEEQTNQHRELSIMSRVFNVISSFQLPEDYGVGISADADVDQGQCPGQDRYKGLYREVPSIWTANLGMFGIEVLKGDDSVPRTFVVEPNHTILADGKGVQFNVEEVPEARPEDFSMKRLSEEDMRRALHEEAVQFYGLEAKTVKVSKSYTKKEGEANRKNNSDSDPLIEVMSRMPTNENNESGTVFASGQGFLAACMTAFAYHLPLALSPDDLWIVIANGFARHVDFHAEELRSNFVAHEGKKEIRIREDRMVKGETIPEKWEELIFPKFSQGIAENVNNSYMYQTMSIQNFTTSTAASQAASEVILMASMKNYFKFRMDTMCGIPNVRLDGTRDDWELLRHRTKNLALWMMQNNTHGDLWIYDIVLPILDEFLKSYDGQPNYCFWQNMVKFRTTGSGSGSFDFLSGWLHTLFPYLSGREGEVKPNPHLKPWLQSASALYLGPKPNEIPIQISSVPVQWVYYEEEFPMHFHAGFRGVEQESDGTVKPVIGWYVTHDPQEGES